MATFNSPTDVTAGSLAKSTDLNNIDSAVAAAFALLPTNASINAGTVNYAADTGIADVYAVALQMTATSYSDGLVVSMKPLYANTGACTLNVDSLGAKSIKTEANGTPAAGDIVAGVPIELRYSSTTGFFHIIKNSAAQATAAAASAAAALVSQNAASGSASSASGSASTATSQALAAGVSAVAALGSQNAAAGSAVAALGSQNAAAGSAVAALGSQNAAAGSAVAALASQGAAAGSAAAALISQNLAEAAWDNLDDRYLGAKSSDPTLDNDGNALITGAMYFNSVSYLMKVYSGTAWNVLGASEVAGDGIDVSFAAGQVTISVDLKANGGLVIESTELALDLGASSITGTLAVGDGGTGRTTSTTAYGLIAAGTTATGAHQTLAAGLTTQILVGGGASALPSWGTDIPTAVTIGSAYIYRAAGTDIPVTDGGTGLSTLTTAYGLLAAGTTATGNVQTLAAGLTTQILVGGGASALPAWGTNIPTAVTIGSAYIYRAGGTDVAVADGGTGASTLTDHGVLLGSGTDAITPLGAMTNGQLVIGSTGADPVVASITDGEGIDTTAGAGTLTIACEDASTSNKGVTIYSGTTKALAGTDTASAMTPADVAAKVAVDVNLRAMSQGVAMTAGVSGNSGIAVTDNDNLNMGTGNFAPYFCGIIPDVTPTTDIILAQKHDATNGWILTLLKTGYLRTTINTTTYDSTATLASIGVVDGENVNILSGITRETDSVAGSVQHYVNGLALGTSVAITAGAPTTVTNAVSLYVLGTSAVRTTGVANTFALFNRCPTAAEVLDLYRNGIAFADKWGSQTALYTSDFSAGVDSFTPIGTGTTITGNIDQDADGAGVPPSNDWLRCEQTDATNGPVNVKKSGVLTALKYNLVEVTIFNPPGSGITHFAPAKGTTPAKDGVIPIAVAEGTEVTAMFQLPATPVTGCYMWATNAAGDSINYVQGTKFYIKDLKTYYAGATLCLLPENAQPAPGMWLDSSTNNLHAIYPAAGASITRPKDSFVIRWVNTWAGTHELQYIGGLNQAILPPNCYVQSILGVVAGGTIEDIIVGDGSDTDHWVAITTGLAAGTVNFTVANAISDGTNYKMTVDPDANFTGSITWTIRGYIYQ